MREVDPSLVVLDLQIGNMGGIATALDLQQASSAGEVPHARSCCCSTVRPTSSWRAARAQGWLIKPLDAFRLRRAARAVAAGDTYFEPSGLIPA